VKSRAELAGDSKTLTKPSEKMVLDLESLDNTASEPLTTRDIGLQLISGGSPLAPNVRCWESSGKHLLAASISPF
jgi:hypothetical protein